MLATLQSCFAYLGLLLFAAAQSFSHAGHVRIADSELHGVLLI